jgi:hypothetical protein
MPISKPWIKTFEALQVNRFCLRSENLVTIGLFTLIFSYVGRILFTMGPAALAASIVLIYVSGLLYLGYLFVITEQTAYGHQRIPPLSAQILTQEKPRIFKLIIIVSMFFSFGYALQAPLAQIIFVLTSAILFPVSMSVLILTTSLIAALNPAKWIAAIRALQMDFRLVNYLGWQLATMGLIYVLLTRDMGWTNILVTLAFVSASITMFRSLGVVLHSNADELGIDVLFSQDITDSKIANAFDNELSVLSDKLYQLSNAGEHNKAQQSYQQHLETNAYASEALMFDRFRKWEDSRFAIKVGRSYIDRLVCAGKNSEAWDVLLFCFRANQNKYRLLTPESVLSLSRGTLSLQQKTVIAHLLSHFPEDFPAHHAAANCLLQAAKYYAQDLADPVLAEQALTQFEQRFPDGTSNTTYLALKEIINSSPNR